MAKDMISGDEPTSVLLIAPTTALVASVALQNDAALRLGRVRNNDLVHVVHGTLDSVFCPHQERWHDSGVTLHTLEDNHVFLRRSSLIELTNLLNCLVSIDRRSNYL